MNVGVLFIYRAVLQLTPFGCLTNQTSSVTPPGEGVRSPVQRTIPEDHSHLRHQSLVPDCDLWFWPTYCKLGFPPLLSLVTVIYQDIVRPTVVQLVSYHLQHQYPVLDAAQLLVQIPANASRKEVAGGPSTYPLLPGRVLEGVSGFWLSPLPAPAFLAVWGVNQRLDLSPSLWNFAFQTNKTHP